MDDQAQNTNNQNPQPNNNNQPSAQPVQVPAPSSPGSVSQNQPQPTQSQPEVQAVPAPAEQTASTTQPPAPAAQPVEQQQSAAAEAPQAGQAQNSRSKTLKRFFLQVLLVSLVCAALVAVVAVLAGSFNNTFAKALGTIAMVALHALLSFGYVSENDRRDKAGQETDEIFGNTVFGIIVASFITSVFAIWQIISLDLTLKLYLFYGVVLFATLHGEVLYRLRGYEKRIDNTVYANYVLMTVVVLMLTFLIFYPERSDLGSFFYRLLAAIGIIDATTTITAIIMHKMFLQKHPELAKETDDKDKKQAKNFWKNPLVVILIIFLTFQFIGGILGLILGGL